MVLVWVVSQGWYLVLQYCYCLDSVCEWFLGELLEIWDIVENGLCFCFDLGCNQNIGLFFDMCLGCCWVQEQVVGCCVFNLFVYICGFLVVVIVGGVSQVVNLDMVCGLFNCGCDNYCLNGYDFGWVSFFGYELFKFWGKLCKFGLYDLVIVDLLSFQKGSFVLIQDYCRIFCCLLELLVFGGILLVCINDLVIGFDFFFEEIVCEVLLLYFVECLENLLEFFDVDFVVGFKVLLFCNVG